MTDHEVLQLIKDNDQQGLTLLYKTYHYEFIHWMIKFSKCSQEDAQEYYQAAILIVYDNVHGNKLERLSSSLKTYLFGIGKNLAWNSYRQDLRKQKAGAEFYLANHVLEDSSAEFMTQEANLELVRACFNQLGDPCHELLDLFYYQKKNMTEIAEKLQYKNTDTAKNQKYKCVERLRKLVEVEIVKQPIQ